MSKRKAFNFYLSYYEVYKQLNTDKDKLSFINALLERQFTGVEPLGLTNMANFAYVSQREVINKQIKGWEDKTGNKLSNPRQGGVSTPKAQEKEKEQEKGNNINSVEVKTSTPNTIDFKKLLDFINTQTKRIGKQRLRVVNQSVKNKYKARLKEGYTSKDIANSIINACKENHHKDSNYKYLTLEFFSRSNTLDKYGFIPEVSKSKVSIENFISNPYNEN